MSKENSDPIFKKAVFSRYVADISQLPEDSLPQVLFAGKSNVGKSSLINCLCRQKKLARHSSEAGKTRGLIFFDVNRQFYLVDLPGYGYANASKKEREAFSRLTDCYVSHEKRIVLILHLIDIRHLPTALDLQMIQWLEERAHPYLLLLNKADKLSAAEAGRAEQAIRKCLQSKFQMLPPMLRVSALTGQGMDTLSSEILRQIELFDPN